MKEISLITQFIFIGSGAIINMFIGIFTTPLITRIVDPEQYGQAIMMHTYANIALMIFSFGLDQALLRFYYIHDNLNYQRKLLAYCVIFSFVFACLCLGLGYFFIKYINKFPFDDYYCYFVLFTLILILNRFSTLVLRLAKKSKLFSFVNIIYKITYVMIALVTINILEIDKVRLLIISNIIACSFATFLAIIGMNSIWRLYESNNSKDFSIITMIRYGFPIMIANGIYMIFHMIDKLSLSHFCSFKEVGIYSSAMSLLSVIAIIHSTFTTIWTPAAVDHYEHDPHNKIFFIKGNSYITVIMFVLGMTIIFCKDLIVLLLGNKYQEAAFILPFLLLQPIMYTISETTVVGIIFKNKTYITLIISLISCLFNYIGNTFLIPILGPKGAAISTGFSYILFFSLRTFFSYLFYPIDFSLVKCTIITVITVIFCFYNTFIKFNFYTILLYISSLVILFILYKKSVSELFEIIIHKLHEVKINSVNKIFDNQRSC